MNNETFKILKRAHKNIADEHELKRIKNIMPNPLMTNQINILLQNININENFEYFVNKFSKIENNPMYKDELIITYLLFIGKILNNTLLIHTFYTPQSQTIFYWISLYKHIVFSIITLMYNKKFTDENWLDLDIMVNQLNEGYSDSIRKFLNKLQVLSIPNEPLEIETKYPELIIITADKFGPFYWRILHFMAEAIHLRKNVSMAKFIWKEFTVYSLHRTLYCSICKEHYKSVAEKYKNELQNSSDYPKLWFNIHNYVNKNIQKTEYSESEFEKDRSIMQNLLK